MVIERSKVTTRSIFGSIRLLEQRQLGLDGIDHLDDVGARLLIHGDEHGRLAVVQAVGADVLGGAVLHVENRRDVAEAHRRAVAVGDDQIAVRSRVARVVVGVDLVVQLVGFDRALGRIGIRVGDGGADVLQADAVLRQRKRIDLDPHRRQRAAVDVDAAHPVNLRQALRDHGIGGVVDLPLREHVGGHGDGHDGKQRSC